MHITYTINTYTVYFIHYTLDYIQDSNPEVATQYTLYLWLELVMHTLILTILMYL